MKKATIWSPFSFTRLDWFGASSAIHHDSSKISRPGNFSFQYANLLWSRTVITVRRSKRTLMLGCNSFAAFFLLAIRILLGASVAHAKRTPSTPKKLPVVQKVVPLVKESCRMDSLGDAGDQPARIPRDVAIAKHGQQKCQSKA